MESIEGKTREQMARMSDLVAQCEDILFDEAPVMVYSVDESCSLLKVNRRWLAMMGYRADQVLGHKYSEFLTEECGVKAKSDVLPLLWEVGRAHSIGFSLLRSNGRVLDVSLDAVVEPQPLGQRHVLGALHDKDDLVQWRQAALTIKALKGLHLAHDGLDRLLSKGEVPDPSATEEQLDEPKEVQEVQTEGAPMLPWELIAVTQDIISSVRALADLGGLQLREIQSDSQKLTLLAETIETTLSELTSRIELPQD
jgi:PAS domain S-box-containing protein